MDLLKLKKVSEPNFLYLNSWRWCKPFSSADFYGNGLFVAFNGEEKEKRNTYRMDLWKFNFAAKFWRKIEISHVPFFLVTAFKVLESNILLFVESGIRWKLKFVCLDSSGGSASLLKEVFSPMSMSGVTSQNICEVGNLIYIYSSLSKKIFILTLEPLACRELTTVPDVKYVEQLLTHYDNKLFLLPRDSPLYYVNTAQCFNLASNEWTTLESPCSNLNRHGQDCECDNLIQLIHHRAIVVDGEAKYHFTCSSECLLNNIRRFHLPSLTMRLLRNIELPQSKFEGVFGYKNDGKVYLNFEDGLYLLDVPFDQPQTLQDLCWETIVDQSRCRPLDSYTSKELHETGIPKKFHVKLFW